MPNAGDSFVTTLKQAHLEWGTYRHTSTRNTIYGEGYLQIPRSDATRIGIYNSNQLDSGNTYNCSSTDGYLHNVTLKASGSMDSVDIYAKQFQGSGNLKLLGDWFDHIGAEPGDRIRVTWVTETDIEIERI